MGSKNVQNGHEIMIFKNDDFSMANDGNILIFMDPKTCLKAWHIVKSWGKFFSSNPVRIALWVRIF